MTEFIQKILLGSTKGLQKLVNEKLANGPILPNFFKWMQIGKRNYGHHSLFKYFKVWNQSMLVWGFRFGWGRPHISKWLFSKEREVFITGYSGLLVILAFVARKNYIKPGIHDNDEYLNTYDNPRTLKARFGVEIPDHLTKYKESAHFLEINKIYFKEMQKHFSDFEDEVAEEYYNSSEFKKRMMYCNNPKYVYEPYGWEIEEEEKKRYQNKY